MNSTQQDQVAVKTSQLRALLNMIHISGHDVSRPDLVEVIGVAAGLAEDACSIGMEEEGQGQKEAPGLGPAPVMASPTSSGIDCHLLSVVAASNA